MVIQQRRREQLPARRSARDLALLALLQALWRAPCSVRSLARQLVEPLAQPLVA